MKTKILLYFVILLLCSCDESSNRKHQIEESQQILNYKLELLKSLQLEKNINKILFVPDNSCKGCLKQTLNLCEKFSANEHLRIYYFNELNLTMNDCARSKKSIKFDIDYINYDIYGITLFELNKDSIYITYVDANNIDSVYKQLLSNLDL